AAVLHGGPGRVSGAASVFFFSSRRRHTRLVSDWSSDVCSSDLSGPMTFDAVDVRIGTVGRAIPGCEVKLAEDGEVICRGGNVFRSEERRVGKECRCGGWRDDE